MRETALLRADFAAFARVGEFIVGYGMDDAGRFRSLPYIAAAH
jgi:hypoxanthine-guanine phosphoribosyltransferase